MSSQPEILELGNWNAKQFFYSAYTNFLLPMRVHSFLRIHQFYAIWSIKSALNCWRSWILLIIRKITYLLQKVVHLKSINFLIKKYKILIWIYLNNSTKQHNVNYFLHQNTKRIEDYIFIYSYWYCQLEWYLYLHTNWNLSREKCVL